MGNQTNYMCCVVQAVLVDTALRALQSTAPLLAALINFTPHHCRSVLPLQELLLPAPQVTAKQNGNCQVAGRVAFYLVTPRFLVFCDHLIC